MEENIHLPIEKNSDLYNLIIPQEVEKKIRYLCNKIHNVEWSGVLFYTYSGSYEENNLRIKCVDILPMDIGSSTYTEFYVDPVIASYMVSHPELLDCQIGLIHSHNNMETFFSGTDLSTLNEEGRDRNHFVSLIVNNAGTYTAAITRKLNIKRVINTTFTYRTFDDIEKEGIESKEVTEEIISYNYLNVIKEGEAIDMFQEIDERLNEINNKKKVVKSSFDFDVHPINVKLPETYQPNTEKWHQHVLFNDEIDYKSHKSDISIDANVVKAITLQLITGSIVISDTSRIDPEKWANQMVKVFDKRFNKNIHLFSEWIEMFADFIVNNFIPGEHRKIDIDDYVSELSKAVYKTLDKLPSNIYIDTIKDTIALWIME